MNQAPHFLDPWKLVWGEPFIDSQTLATAIEQDLKRETRPDFRTRLLVRDAALAIRSYLPAHWQNRRQWLGDFGGLRVYVVDEYDLFVSKLSSKLEKHQSDLSVLALKLDTETARHRLAHRWTLLPR
jgi:hypothetical protein